MSFLFTVGLDDLICRIRLGTKILMMPIPQELSTWYGCLTEESFEQIIYPQLAIVAVYGNKTELNHVCLLFHTSSKMAVNI